MGFIKKFIKKFIISIIVLSIAVFFFQNQVVELAINLLVRSKTNARIEISKVDSKIQKGYIRLENVTLLNPKGFKEPRLAEINLLLLELDLSSLIKKEIIIKRVLLDVDKVYIVKQKLEGTNFVSVKKTSSKNYKKSRTKKSNRILIQNLEVKISDVFEKDFRKKPPEMSRKRLGLELKQNNVTDIRKLFDLIQTQYILKAAVSKFR
ncbi:MAG: hypothetical protein P9M06_00485 [Candidatus Saelkia tenebricola]|nr:hypothetical protein [Candidatus Saelkia tenebricola]